MIKKILFSLGALVVIAGGVAGMSAYEAHVINVTAHVENALTVSSEDLDFGTVFPQEYVEKEFTVQMSNSFIEEGYADDIDYVIKQKPKCICQGEVGTADCPHGQYAPVSYLDDECPSGYVKMKSLCGYLSKMDGDPDDDNDEGVPSYYQGTGCMPFNGDEFALGRLAKSQQDTSDVWIIDLKVPPFGGYVAQDWPAGCPLLKGDPNGEDFGCDLWLEVTNISRTGTPVDENIVSISLENKDENWNVIVDDVYGTLVYPLVSSTFDYEVTAQGLQPNTEYSLIYYAGPWPGNNPGAFIGSGMTDASGNIAFSGSPDLGMDLPDSADANYPAGAKIWLVPSSHYSEAEKKLATWDPSQYLFEYDLILYNDTDI